MEPETLFTSSKWDILKSLEKGKKSPIELAQESKTSVANISQQLRLLELAGFVKSERVSNRDKGLPRIAYSLASNQSYLVVSAENFVQKKFLKPSSHQINIMRIWFLENKELHSYLEKFYWAVEKYLEKTDFIAVDLSDSKQFKVKISGENVEVKKTIKDVSIEGPVGTKNFVISFSKTEIQEVVGNYIIFQNYKTIA